MDEIMKMDVNDTGEGVQLLANMLAKCALELYELTESDFSLCIETNDGRNIEISIREIGEEDGNDNDMQEYRKAVAMMREAKEIGNPEESHSRADDILCGLLRSMGYNEIVDIFESIDKWYA